MFKQQLELILFTVQKAPGDTVEAEADGKTVLTTCMIA